MSNQPNQRISVLVIDDGSAERESVLEALRADSQFCVCRADSPLELDRWLAQQPFDVALCDLRLWGSPELEILCKLRERDPRLAVMILTARGSEHWAVEALRQGASDYLAKTPGFLDRLPARLVSVATSAARHAALAGTNQFGARAWFEDERDRLFAQSLSLLCIFGWDGYLRRWNPALSAILGYSDDELRTLPMLGLIHPEDLQQGTVLGWRMRSGERISGVELRVRCKNGSYKTILWNAAPCLEQRVHFVTGQDISARKQVEQQLRESEERFQLVASATKEAVWDWDLRENRIWYNEGYLKAYGSPAEHVDRIVEWWTGRIHPDDRERVLAQVGVPEVDGYRQWLLEYRVHRLDGTYAHVYDRGFAVFDAQNVAVRMVGSIMDVSELKNTEERLRESEERFRLAAKASSDAIWDWDLRKDQVWRSEGFQTILGYAPAEIDNDVQWWVDRIHPDDRERVYWHFSPNGQSDPLQRATEYRFRRADGAYVHVADRGYVMYDASGNAVRAIGSMTDLTERRRAEEIAHMHQAELAHIARVSTMGEIATGLAHELNQPLTAITNYAESCAHAISSHARGRDEKLLDWIGKIIANTHRAGEMIRRLRGFTRKSEPRRSTVAVDDLVQEVLDLMEPETRLSDTRVRWEPRHDLHITVDRIQIQQVLVNLLRNAFEAMLDEPDGGRRVTIAASIQEKKLEISVEDCGEGIAPADLERVFDAFFTSKPTGVGIGLAISRSIVEDHGGRLWVTSNPKQGVTFRFTLPLSGAC